MKYLNILVLGLIYAVVSAEEEKYTVNVVSQFPVPVDVPIKFQLHVKIEDEMKTLSTMDTMVIRIADKNGNLQERFIFDYGMKNTLDAPYDGRFVSISEWVKDKHQSMIDISISFKRIANDYVLEMYDLPAQTFKQRRTMLNNLKLANRFYREIIRLSVQPKLQLLINSHDGNSIELGYGKYGSAICRSYDGIPNTEPYFKNSKDFDITGSTFDNKTNEIKILFRVRVSDHNKHLICESERSSTSMIIKVLHRPSEIVVEPSVGKTLQSDSIIMCYTYDGYPPPKIQWHLIQGPQNASSYYDINDNGKQLYMKVDAPSYVMWKFQCVAQYHSETFENISKTVNFTITDANRICNYVCLIGRLLKLQHISDAHGSNITDLNLKTDKTVQELVKLKANIEKLNQRRDRNNFDHNPKQGIELLKQEIDSIIRDKIVMNETILLLTKQIGTSNSNDKAGSGNSVDEIAGLKLSLKTMTETIGTLKKQMESMSSKYREQIGQIQESLTKHINFIVKSKIDSSPFKWLIDRISSRRKTQEIVISSPMQADRKMYTLFLKIYFYDQIKVHVVSYQNISSENKAVYPVSLETTIAVMNADNPEYFRMISKSFVLEMPWDDSPSFIFNYNDPAKMFMNDSIIIKYFVAFK